eukprot:GHVS01037709.1.p1 GENE.GHVS01037709.1~~GHVS01037709.1.p1  ORF type:complete len:289 (+),score=51.66 GHVS01037709.1:368-1234(+)
MSGFESEEVLSAGADSVTTDAQHDESSKPTVSKAKRRMEEIMKNKKKGVGAAGTAGEDAAVGVIDTASHDSNPPLRGPASSAEKLWSHDTFPPISAPSQIQYCPFCGLPPDFCEFSECWESQCRPWVLKNYPQYYPELAAEAAAKQSDGKDEVADVQDDLSSLTFLGGGDKVVGDPLAVEEAPKKKPAGSGGKKSTAKPAGVTIQKVSRAKKKTVTVVIGLETLGVKLDKASKLFSKRFSCGASVVKGGSGLPDQIDIQGDVSDQLEEVITTNFPEVAVENIAYLRSK